jgi:hypothetical protein
VNRLLAALVVVLFGGGALLADEVCLVKVDVKAQEVTVKVCDKNQTQVLDARRVKVFDRARKEIKLEDLEKMEAGTKLEFKTRDGRISELKLTSSKN